MSYMGRKPVCTQAEAAELLRGLKRAFQSLTADERVIIGHALGEARYAEAQRDAAV